MYKKMSLLNLRSIRIFFGGAIIKLVEHGKCSTSDWNGGPSRTRISFYGFCNLFHIATNRSTMRFVDI